MSISYLILVGAIALVGFLVQNQMTSRFRKYGQIPLSSGQTGYQVAMAMLNHYGITDVSIVRAKGFYRIITIRQRKLSSLARKYIMEDLLRLLL